MGGDQDDLKFETLHHQPQENKPGQTIGAAMASPISPKTSKKPKPVNCFGNMKHQKKEKQAKRTEKILTFKLSPPNQAYGTRGVVLTRSRSWNPTGI